MNQAGFQVTLICSYTPQLNDIIAREGIEYVSIPFKRKIQILYDIYSLIKLIITLHALKPKIVNVSTPKASLIGMIASFITMVPFRIYLIRGLRYETFNGLQKMIYVLIEKLICLLSTNIVSISNSIRETVLNDKICTPEKISVLLKGSSNGININSFFKSDYQLIQKPSNTLMLGYVGRLCEDKGTPELIKIYNKIAELNSFKIQLLIVGEFDSTSKFRHDYEEIIINNRNIHKTGFVDNVYSYLRLMDIFIFPSKREGFGNAIIEASLTKLPIVAFDIPGVRDAVINKFTGLLSPSNNLSDFINNVQVYIDNPELRIQHGLNGYKWVIENFDRNKILTEWQSYYNSL
ncbi:MAG: glycosyltransferase [Romboutsia sp.]|nr:glycosyltransferase [Romboutsia sp.]